MQKINQRLVRLALTGWLMAQTTLIFADNAPAPLDKVVAIVNSDVITQGELNTQLTVVQAQLRASQVPLPSDQELQAQVLNHMIDEKIQLQTAERAGVEVDDEMLDQSIERVAARNQMTMAQFQQALEAEGLNYKNYREQIRKQITVDRILQREVKSRIEVTPQEVDKYLNSVAYAKQNIDEYHLSDILIALPEIPSSAQITAANQKAEAIISELKQGKSFAKLAAAQSAGSEALQGGDLGWRRIEEIPTVFASQITTIKTGEIIGPIRAANGIHILMLNGTRGSIKQHTVAETEVRHILLKNNGLYGDAETQALVAEIRRQIANGADFAEMAKKYSEDKGAAMNGGELGWVTPGVLVPPFEQAMNQLKIGEVSQPVKTQFGWHLIKVEGRRNKDNTEDYQREQIQKFVYERKFQEESQKWTKQMRDASFVEIVS